MATRSVVFCLAFFTLTGACMGHPAAPAFAPPPGRQPAPPPAPPATAESLGLSPAPGTPAMPAPDSIPTSLEESRRIRKAYEQLPPDGRFLRALEDLPYLLGKGARAHISTERSGDHWSVLQDGKPILEVADTADFPELEHWLAERALTLGAQKGTAEKPSDVEAPVLVDEALAKELIAVNDAWSRGALTADLAARAAHAALSVAYELTDVAGVGDSVEGRAFALLALARATGGEDAQDEALLAFELGYTRTARALAGKLPPANAVRLAILKDDTKLRLLADAPGARPGLRYLWIRRLGEIGTSADMDAVEEAQSARDSQAFAGAFARQGSLEMHGEWGLRSSVLELTALQGLVAPGILLATTRDALRGNYFKQFEALIAALPDPGRVPFDREQVRSASRARFYSGLWDEMDRRIFQRSIAKEGTDLLSTLGPATGLSSEVRAWLEFLVATRSHQEALEVMTAVSTGWPHLGVAATDEALEDAVGVEVAGLQDIVAIARVGMCQLDSRPAHLRQALHGAERLLADEQLKFRLVPRYLVLAYDPWLEALAGWWFGNEGAMEQLAADTSSDPKDRYAAVRRLLKDEAISEDEASRRLRRIADVGTAALKSDYGWWLRGLERWDDLIAFLAPVIATHPDDDSLTAGDQRAALSRAYWATGKLEQAWKVIEPAMSTGKASVMYSGAVALLGVGRRDEALKLAEEYRERYARSGNPGAALASYAAVLWRAGKFEAAAAALNNPEISVSQLRKSVGPAFASSFHRQVSPDEERALDLLVKAIPAALPDMARGMATDRAPELTWQVASKAPAGSIRGDLELYLELKKIKGAAEATKWFTTRQDHAMVGILTREAYVQGADELMFLYSDPTDGTEEASTIWALRAAALVRTHVSTGQARDEIVKHFQAPPPANDTLRPYARFVLGLDPESALSALDTSSAGRARHGFFRAVSEEGAGQIGAAADDYIDSLECDGATSVSEWSHDRLMEWQDSGKSFLQLSAVVKPH